MFNNKWINVLEDNVFLLTNRVMALENYVFADKQPEPKKPVNGFSKVKAKVSTAKTKRKYTKKSPYWGESFVAANKTKRGKPRKK